ncbi:MAG: transglutaminase domain-containing protein [Ignavibacteriaceae bacterium]
MNNLFKFKILILIIFICAGFLYSQEPPIKWGEIPQVDLEMKSYPKDTNATAVILCDYGESDIDDDFNIIFDRILRVKILNRNGYKWGTLSIVLNTKDHLEDISNIEGVTYNLDDNGKIAATELDNDDIFEEKIDDDHTGYKFTLPNLKPGCIIEVKYKIISRSIYFIQSWTFQHDEPVEWSEYRVFFPPNIVYDGIYSGFEPWYAKQLLSVDKHYGGYASTILGEIVKCHEFRYVVKDAPAIREEPYITTTDDYVNKVEIQLAGYVFPRSRENNVLGSWEKVVSELIENDNFGEKIDVTGDVEDLAAKITKDLITPEDKVKAVYNWVTKSIVWDGKNRVTADNDVDDVLELKKGSNAEITFLLLSLLKSVGIEGYPVILSTRGNGKMQELYPIINQFNYCVAKVVIGNKSYIIDGTNPLRPMDLLPSKILGVSGLAIKEGEGPVEWINFTCDKNNINKTLINVKINKDGSLTGIVDDSYGEYRSLSVREDLRNKKEIDFAKELFDSESEGFSIDSVSILNKDSLDAPLKIKSQISSSAYVQKSGDLVYINPFMVHRLKENPFKTKVRKFPVDYAYPNSIVIIMNYELPEGYELKEPFSKKGYYLENDIAYTRQMMVENNRIQIISKMEIKNSTITPNDYEKLKNIYSQNVSAQSEQLVIGPKKIPDKPGKNAKTKTEKINVGSK